MGEMCFRAWVWGCGEDPNPQRVPQVLRGQAGIGKCRAGPLLPVVNTFVCMDSIIFIYLCIYAVSVQGEQHIHVCL